MSTESEPVASPAMVRLGHFVGRPSLREIFDRNEGRLVHKCDHYFPIYERHLGRYRGRSPRILEIGVFHGGSLDMWRAYFGRGTHIVGVDIAERCRSLGRRGVDIRIGDQGDAEFVASLVADGPFDIVIDDGSHLPAHQILALETLWPAVRVGGVMLIEDLCTNYWPEYGGAPRAPGTFIEFVKPLIDDVNAFNSRTPGFEPTEWTRTLGGIHVYDSVVVFDRADTTPLQTRMSGRPVFDEIFGQPALDVLTPEHRAQVEAMNRPWPRIRRAVAHPAATFGRLGTIARGTIDARRRR